MYIPSVLVEQILMKLPMKSLLRCKCVSKEWHYLISHPEFIERHFNYGSRTEKLMFISPDVNHFRSINFTKSLHDESAYQSLSVGFLGHHPQSCVQIKGSCRGFILLQFCCTFLYLWNPSTGQNKMIQWSSSKDVSWFSYGLGYDPRTKDYMVVAISFTNQPKYISVKENAWMQIQHSNFPYKSCCFWNDNQNNLMGTFFNNALHWFVYNYETYRHVVLAFDLTRRAFSEIQLPDEFDFVHSQPHALNVFGETLSLYSTREMGQVGHSIQIWELKQYTDHTSWTKTKTLIINNIWVAFFLPICNSTETGHVIGSDPDGILAKWNEDGKVEEQRTFNYIRSGYQVIMYQETLFTI